MLRADELASIRTTINGFLPDLAVINRGGSALSPQPTMPDGSQLRCRVRPDTRENQIEDADALQQQRRWKIKLPDGTPVQAGDQIVTLGTTYGVVELGNPNSFSVETTVYAFVLFDASGVPVYLRPNATVQVLRAAVQVGPNSITVRMEAPGEQRFTAMGGERIIHVLFPMGTDVRMTDDIRILTYGQVAFPRPGPYEAQDAIPVGETGLQAIRVCLVGFTL